MFYGPNIPRCQHIKINGTQCGSPAVKRNRFRFFHKRWHEQRIVINSAKARSSRPSFDFPVLEDANSIQVGLMQVMRLLLNGQLDTKTAGVLLYALQTASSNLRLTTFDPAIKTTMVIDPRCVDQANSAAIPGAPRISKTKKKTIPATRKLPRPAQKNLCHSNQPGRNDNGSK